MVRKGSNVKMRLLNKVTTLPKSLKYLCTTVVDGPQSPSRNLVVNWLPLRRKQTSKLEYVHQDEEEIKIFLYPLNKIQTITFLLEGLTTTIVV